MPEPEHYLVAAGRQGAERRERLIRAHGPTEEQKAALRAGINALAVRAGQTLGDDEGRRERERLLGHQATLRGMLDPTTTTRSTPEHG